MASSSRAQKCKQCPGRTSGGIVGRLIGLAPGLGGAESLARGGVISAVGLSNGGEPGMGASSVLRRRCFLTSVSTARVDEEAMTGGRGQESIRGRRSARAGAVPMPETPPAMQTSPAGLGQ